MMRQKLDEYLEENGIEAQCDDNDVVFSINRLNYVCRFFSDDPYYIQIMLPHIDQKSAHEVRDIIADINRRFKVAKIIEVDDNPWIVADCFVYSIDKGKLLIGRMVRVLTDVYEEYRQLTSETEILEGGQQE